MRAARYIVWTVAVIAVVGLLLAAGIIWYPRHHAPQTTAGIIAPPASAPAEPVKEWTAESIANDPASSLDLCEQQVSKAVVDLKVDRIAAAINRVDIERMSDKAAQKVHGLEKLLKDLKTIYEEAERSHGWPVSWEGRERDKDWIKGQFQVIDNEAKTQRTIVETADRALRKVDIRCQRIETARADARTQLAAIADTRELLKLQKLTNESKGRLISIKAMVQSVVDTASEGNKVISLDELTDERGSVIVDDARFEEIMSRIK